MASPLRLTGPPAALQLTGPPPASAAAAEHTRETAVPPGEAFRPRYEWQEIGADVAVPPGLDVELPLDGRPRRARIPPRWQLKVWVDDAAGYWRFDGVRRGTTARELRLAAAESIGWPGARLVLNGEPVGDRSTAEQLDLFSRARELNVCWASDVGLYATRRLEPRVV